MRRQVIEHREMYPSQNTTKSNIPTSSTSEKPLREYSQCSEVCVCAVSERRRPSCGKCYAISCVMKEFVSRSRKRLLAYLEMTEAGQEWNDSKHCFVSGERLFRSVRRLKQWWTCLLGKNEYTNRQRSNSKIDLLVKSVSVHNNRDIQTTFSQTPFSSFFSSNIKEKLPLHLRVSASFAKYSSCWAKGQSVRFSNINVDYK